MPVSELCDSPVQSKTVAAEFVAICIALLLQLCITVYTRLHARMSNKDQIIYSQKNLIALETYNVAVLFWLAGNFAHFFISILDLSDFSGMRSCYQQIITYIPLVFFLSLLLLFWTFHMKEVSKLHHILIKTVIVLLSLVSEMMLSLVVVQSVQNPQNQVFCLAEINIIDFWPSYSTSWSATSVHPADSFFVCQSDLKLMTYATLLVGCGFPAICVYILCLFIRQSCKLFQSVGVREPAPTVLHLKNATIPSQSGSGSNRSASLAPIEIVDENSARTPKLEVPKVVKKIDSNIAPVNSIPKGKNASLRKSFLAILSCLSAIVSIGLFVLSDNFAILVYLVAVLNGVLMISAFEFGAWILHATCKVCCCCCYETCCQQKSHLPSSRSSQSLGETEYSRDQSVSGQSRSHNMHHVRRSQSQHVQHTRHVAKHGSSSDHESSSHSMGAISNINKFKVPAKARYYTFAEEIGKGAFGRVYKCIDTRNGDAVALKCIPMRHIDRDRRTSIEQEVQLLKEISASGSHDNIVRYIDSFEEQSFLFIVLEYVPGGSLKTQLKHHGGKFPERLVCFYVLQILNGLCYLHNKGIIHRDIKAANILITKDGCDGVAKLADFGVAVRQSDINVANSDEPGSAGNKDTFAVRKQSGTGTYTASDVAGSPYWMAPEIIEMKGQISGACDIWAVGATAIELFTGKPPYYRLQSMSALFRIVQDPHPHIPIEVTPLFRDFLNECFVRDPKLRKDAQTMKMHTWLKQGLNNWDYSK